MKRLLMAALGAALLIGQAGVAAADPFGPPGRGGPGHFDDWRGPWPRPHAPVPPLGLFLIYPPPPPPGPQVVYVPQPIQAVPASDPYVDSLGRYCREYQTTVMVGGQPQSSYGTACRMPDGTWRIVR